MKLKPVLPSILIIALVTSLTSGCSTVRNLMKDDQASAESGRKAVADITRPPEITDNAADRAVETSPEETISFDEWRKQREQATKEVIEKTAEEASSE